jgi:hypothetical protein
MSGRSWLPALALLVACGSPRLANVSTQPPSAECSAGGVLIEQGTDDNDDGVLQTSEVDSSELLCNGADAADAFVDTAAEPAGVNCANGGTRIRIGFDADRDGVLADDEVQQVAYVCNADAGTPTLVDVAQEPIGSNCSLGGVVVRSGDDLDHDGALDPSEVTSTSYVCTGEVPVNETINGDFYLRNTFDQAVLVHVKHITGTLYVMPNAYLTDPIAPKLEDAYQVVISETFDSLSLPTLATLTGALDVTSTADFETLSAPTLVQVGSVSITPKARLATVNLQSLATVVSTFKIDQAPLTTLTLGALSQIGGEVWIRKTQLSTLSLPMLSSMGFRAYIYDHPNLASVAMPALQSVGTLELMDLPLLTALDLRSLTSADGFALARAPQLPQSQFQIGAITSLPYELVLSALPWTNVQPFESLVSVGTLWLSDFPQLANLSGLSNLTAANWISITNNSTLTSITGFQGLGRVVERLEISNNAQLVSISGFSSLTEVTSRLWLMANGFTQLSGFGNIQTVGQFVIGDNPYLSSVTGFDSLQTASSLSIGGPELFSISAFPNLQTVSALNVGGPKLATVTLPALRSATEIRIADTPVTTVSFPLLSDAVVRLNNVSLLADVSGFPLLRNGGVNITSANELVTYLLPNLETGGASIWYAPKLATVSLPAFRDGGLSFDTVPLLSSISAPLAQRLTQFWINGAAVSQLRFPVLQRTQVFVFQMVPLLESLEMPALTQFDPGTGLLVNAPRLPACQVTQLISQTGYTGSAIIYAPPCETIDRCRLSAPTTVTTNTTTGVNAIGQVRILGLTDDTSGTDVSVVQRAQVGEGTRGTEPSGATWSWFDATPTASWNDAQAVGFDEYRASLMFAAGSYDVAVRFSGDGGRTWTYCDLNVAPGSDGSEDGYQVANAGHVEAQ